MALRYPGFLTTAPLTLTLALGFWTSPVPGQTPRGDRDRPAATEKPAEPDREKVDAPTASVSSNASAPVAPPSVSRLFMVVGTDPFQRDVDLRNKFLLAASKVEPNNQAKIEVRAISRETHDELAKLISQGPVAEGPPSAGIQVAPFAGNDRLWEISTGNPELYLTGVDLTLAAAGDGKAGTVHLDAKSKTETEAKLRYHKPGLYLLTLDSATPPKSAILLLKDAKGVTKSVPMKWPVSDRYFIVSLENFRASPQALTDALKDRKVMGTPFKSVGPVEPMSLVLADLRSQFGSQGQVWNKNTFEVQIPGLKDAETTRIWILFPLTRRQRDEELIALNKQVEEDSQSAVSKRIRERSERAPAGGEAYVIRPQTEPRWYELVGGEDKPFAGKFKLEGVDQWEVEDEYHWLIVYEFGDGPTATPNPVMKDRVVDGVHETAPVLAFDQEVPEFPKGIKQLKKR